MLVDRKKMGKRFGMKDDLNDGVEVYRGPVYIRVGGKSFIECEECDCCDCPGEDCPFNEECWE